MLGIDKLRQVAVSEKSSVDPRGDCAFANVLVSVRASTVVKWIRSLRYSLDAIGFRIGKPWSG